MTEQNQKVEKPDDRLSITIDDKVRELFMSAGLLRRLAAYVGGPDGLQNVFTDPSHQILLMVEVLKPRTPNGAPATVAALAPATAYSLEDFPMSTADGEKMSDWISGHLTYFFINGVLTFKKNLEGPAKILQNLTPFQIGSEDSLTKKVSPGPSDAASAAST